MTRVLIPAAGMATRLRPLTNDKPKCLLTINGKSLLERSLSALKASQITDITIVLGYRGAQIRQFVAEHFPMLAVHFIENPLFETTNNIYSLYLMREDAEGQDVILLDSDIIFDPAILTTLLQDKAPNTLALNTHQLGEEEIKVVVDQQGHVSEISKVCDIHQAIGESIGIEKMSATYTAALFPELEQMIEREGLSNVFYEKAFERLIPKGHFFSVTDVSHLFAAELDTPEDFQLANSQINHFPL